MHFDLSDLRLFAAIADEGNLTRGAARVHTSVSAASTRVKHLEERLGVKLLHRTSHGVTLSAAGEAFAHQARLVMNQIEHLNSDLGEYARGLKGQLRLFANTTAVTEFLPQVLGRFLATHPDVNIDLKEHLSSEIVRAVRDGQADVGIVASTAGTQGLEVRPYREDRLVVVVPQNHRLADSAGVLFADTLAYDHVGLHEGSAIHAFLQEMAGDLNRRMKLRIQVGNFEASCRMVESGVGVSVMPASAALRYRKYVSVRVLPLQDVWSRRSLQICARKFDRLPKFARQLVELLDADAQAASGAARRPRRRPSYSSPSPD